VKLGFLTACLPGQELEDIADWAAAQGYQGLEVAAWPAGAGADGPAHLDVAGMSASTAEAVRDLLTSRGLEMSAIAYYDNNLHGDAARREATHQHLRACIDAAQMIGCPFVGTFVGRDVGLSVDENLRLAEKVLPPLVTYAEDRGVRLVVENCPMEGWHPDGYPANLAYSPELWEWMSGLGLYLNFDPSHLVWLGIDPVQAVKSAGAQILHVQAKDVQVQGDGLNRFGFYGRAVDRTNPWDTGWWRYRIPGLGAVEWGALVDALYESGFDGFISVEHEDPVWSGTPGKVQQGLVIAHRTLSPLLVG
jgi:sugar phosphate isomerase/epimerase